MNTKRRYPSDLTDEEWAILEPVLFPPNPHRLGRKPTVNLREVCNAIFYLTKTGCQWRYLPKDFPPPTTVNYYHTKWIHNGLWAKANQVLRECCRQQAGRNREPSAGVIDSQSVKGTPESGGEESGFDGFKRVKGRKRHIITDTMGYVLTARVHAANLVDTHMARHVVSKLLEVNDTVKIIFADGGYMSGFINWCAENTPLAVEVVKRNCRGFKVLPKRWVVERTFGWLSRQRRLGRDYERHTRTSETMIYISMTKLMLQHLCPQEKKWKTKVLPEAANA
jgi:putative transposase